MKPEKHIEPQIEWGRAANWYDELVGESGSEYHREVVLPGAIRLLGLKAGDAALDVGCGQGVLCRVLQQAGVRMTGVDSTGELLKLARQRSDQSSPNIDVAATSPVPAGAPVKPEIQYIKADICDPGASGLLTADYFNAAACILAIQNINPLPPVFENVARCLKSDGRFVIVMMHPCFRSPKYTSWGWEGANTQYRRVDRYLLPRKEPIVTHPGKDPKRYTWTYHRPIGTYIKALRNAGMMVDAIEEWPSHKISQPGPRAAAENLARKEIPMFMAIRAVKIAAAKA